MPEPQMQQSCGSTGILSNECDVLHNAMENHIVILFDKEAHLLMACREMLRRSEGCQCHLCVIETRLRCQKASLHS